jgi:hypothetical protein
MTNKSVPVLVTWDVDLALWIPLDERKLVLNAAIDVCHSLNIRATFFFTAQPAYMCLDEMQKMLVQGHEIGYHGLTHGDEEDHDRMLEEMQRSYIPNTPDISSPNFSPLLSSVHMGSVFATCSIE